MRIISPIILLTLAAAVAAENQVRAELIADAQSIAPGETFRAGVLFGVPERAHIYWRNPGDSGLATGIEWQLPDGAAVGELQWPNPHRFTIEGLDDVNYGYEQETLIFSEVVFKPETADSKSLIIRASAYWLVCLDDGACIPEKAELTLTISVESATRDSGDAHRFDSYAARVPKPLAEFRGDFECNTVKPYLWINLRQPTQVIAMFEGEEAAFFPDAGPRWTRILPTDEEGSVKATFHREGPDPPDAGGMHALPKGVMTLPIGDPRTNEVHIEYIRINE